jgi:hypothetical protein
LTRRKRQASTPAGRQRNVPSGVNRYGPFAAEPDPKSALAPKTDLIPMPNPVVQLLALCNRAEEYDYAGSSE